MEDMRKFEKPEMEVIVFEAEDIIMTSGNQANGVRVGADYEDFTIDSVDGAADVTEPSVQTTSEGTAETADSPSDSHVVDESVIDNEYGIEEPVTTEEVIIEE